MATQRPAKAEKGSFVRRLGANRTFWLLMVIVLLVTFTVVSDIPAAIGLQGGGGDREFVRFQAGGRPVVLTLAQYERHFRAWLDFMQGLAPSARASREDFLRQFMVAELAKDAGIVISDETLRQFIENLDEDFKDPTGKFDRENFEEELQRRFRRMTPRMFEEQARRLLAAHQYQQLYGSALYTVNDGELYQSWKSEHPKVKVVYTWQSVAAIRAGLKPEDVTPQDLEAWYAREDVKARHMREPRRSFDAVSVRLADVDEAAYAAAREQRKDDRDLALGESEAYDYWRRDKEYDFNTRTHLAALTGDAKKEEKKEEGKKEEKKDDEKKPDEKAPDAPPEKEQAPPPDPLAGLDDAKIYEKYWRPRIEREAWFKRLVAKIVREATEKKSSLGDAMKPYDQPGLGLKLTRVQEPLDQIEVEKILGPEIRYVLNTYGPDKEGAYHEEPARLSNIAEDLAGRGWAVFQVLKVIPKQAPKIEEIREKLVGEILDDRAKQQARERLVALQKRALDERKTLAEVAKEMAFEVEEAGPFNEYSWRPPYPKPKKGEEPPPPAEVGKDPRRRQTAVVNRYMAFRGIETGGFSTVVDDTSGTGNMILGQAVAREDPRPEEMTEAHRRTARYRLIDQRAQALNRMLDYDGLKERCNLLLDGKPAPSRKAAGSGEGD